MKCLELDVLITPSGLPALQSDETIIEVRKGIGLYESDDRVYDYDNGNLYITSNRLVWTEEGSMNKGFTICFSQIDSMEHMSPFLRQSGKIILNLSSLKSKSKQNKLVSWICHVCNHVNKTLTFSEKKCTLCGVLVNNHHHSDIQAHQNQIQQQQIHCLACTYLNHYAIESCEMCGHTLKNKDEIEEGEEEWTTFAEYKLSFRKGGSLEAFKTIQEAKRSYQERQRLLQEKSSTTSTLRNKDKEVFSVGVSSIMKKMDLAHTQGTENLLSAFQDMESLMAKANEMMKLADYLNFKLANDNESSELLTFRRAFARLGISNNITRESLGDDYHRELAKQLSDFLDMIIHQYGSMMSLIDLYCIFNKSRGIPLISPQDLLQAINNFKALNLPYQLKTFQSGLMVIMSDARTDEELAKTVFEYIQMIGGNGLTAYELSIYMNVPVILATEQLLISEQYGFICRDDTIEGFRFYENKFTKYSYSIKYK